MQFPEGLEDSPFTSGHLVDRMFNKDHIVIAPTIDHIPSKRHGFSRNKFSGKLEKVYDKSI